MRTLCRRKFGDPGDACKRFGMSIERTQVGSMASRVERRTSRSSDPLIALSRLLESTRARARLPALAVADSSGLLVAGAGAYQDCEELAAYAPLLMDTAVANDAVEPTLEALSTTSSVRRVAVEDLEVLVCGRGDPAGRERALPELALGCQRILRTRRPVL
jgi:hypothetical protein